MKHILLSQGVQIFEDCPAFEINAQKVITPATHFQADTIVVCIDPFIRDFKKLLNSVYHVQTFLMMSSPLTEKQADTFFPHSA